MSDQPPFPAPIRIEQWAIVGLFGKPRLMGNVYGHHHIKDGENATTTSIIGKKNGFIHTRSGSVYQLGEPLAELAEDSADNLALTRELP